MVLLCHLLKPDTDIEGIGYGIFLFTEHGEKRLKNYAASKNMNPNNLQTQEDFVIEDLKNSRFRNQVVYNLLQAATTTAEASDILYLKYLTPTSLCDEEQRTAADIIIELY